MPGARALLRSACARLARADQHGDILLAVDRVRCIAGALMPESDIWTPDFLQTSLCIVVGERAVDDGL